MLFRKLLATDFFEQWRAFSVDALRALGLPVDPGGKTRKWKHGQPIGLIEHYTAGVGWRGSINWLQGAHNKNSSCHAFVLDRKLKELDPILSLYPLVGEHLHCTAFLLSDIDEGTWHAGWVNSLCFGIENRNAGLLKGEQEDWRWWAKGWTAKFPHEKLGKTPVSIDGQWWEPYTYWQIADNIIIGQMLRARFDGKLDPSWFLPHSATSTGKSDTGRAYPLNDVREAVFNDVAVTDLGFLQDFKADPMYMDAYDEELDEDILVGMAASHADRPGGMDDDEWDDACASVSALTEDGPWRDELPAVRRALHALGYYVPATSDTGLDTWTKQAVWTFQRSHGLKTDGIPGNKETQPALAQRLKRFKISLE